MTGARRDPPDPDAVRAFHRKFVTGVTIVTAMDGDIPRGLAVNAFSSISLSPALVLVCVARTAATHDPLYRAERFAVNVLAHDQAGLARHFGSRRPDKFEGIPWRVGAYGCPVLDGVCAYLEAELRERVHASTHTIFIGRILAAASTPTAPLVYMASQFYNGGSMKPA